MTLVQVRIQTIGILLMKLWVTDKSAQSVTTKTPKTSGTST